MRRFACIAAAFALTLSVAGCTHARSSQFPAACTNGFGSLLKALEAAPGKVTLDGTPISGCFTRDASGDQIQILGTDFLVAAQQLGDKARAGDHKAALQLGYLVGAAERGASHNNNLGDEIVRRITAETGGLGAARAEYERGLHAGLTGG